MESYQRTNQKATTLNAPTDTPGAGTDGGSSELETAPDGRIKGFRKDGSPYCLLEYFLRTRQVNLITGPTHAGKSLLIDNIVALWSRGDPVFGKYPYPLPWWYVTLNKSSGMVRDLKYVYRSRRYTALEDLPVSDKGRVWPMDLIERCRDQARKLHSQGLGGLGGGDPDEYEDPRVLWIEELDAMLGGDSNRDLDVREFMGGLVSLCGRHNLTIVGTLSSAKWRRNDRVLLPVERVKGSTSWPSCAADVIYIEHENPTDPSSKRRKIDLVPRRGVPERHVMEFKGLDEDGYSTVEFKRWYSKGDKLDMYLREKKTGSIVTFAQVQEWAHGAKLSMASAKRWIRRKVEAGELKKRSHGVYVRSETEVL